METKVQQVSATEQRIAAELRHRAMEHLEKNGVSTEEFAERLGLLPAGGEVLLRRSHWSVDVAIRVAEALGIPVELEA